MPDLKTKSETTVLLAASMISAIGAVFFLIMPLFLGVLAEEYGLSDTQIGLLGSAYLAGFTLLSTSAIVWIDRANLRRITGLGLASLIACCAILVFGKSFTYVLVVVSAMGCGAGTVFAVALRIISNTKNPDRGFGVKLFAEQVLGASLLLIIPAYFLPSWGLTGLIIAVVAAILLFSIAALFLPESDGKRAVSIEDNSSSSTVTVWLGLLGLGVFMLGLSGVWAFVERIGNDAGLSATSIGAMLSVGLVFGAIGAALAAVVGDSIGHKLPQVIGTVLLALCLYLLFVDLTVIRFGIAASLLSGMWNYMLAYQMGSVARDDKSSRMALLIAPAIALGATLGPGIAGLLKTGPGYGPIHILAIACVVSSTALFVVVDNRIERSSSS